MFEQAVHLRTKNYIYTKSVGKNRLIRLHTLQFKKGFIHFACYSIKHVSITCINILSRNLCQVNGIHKLTYTVISGCIVVSALATDVLGSDETRTGGTGPWCWISTSADHQVFWMVITGKGWEIACYLITMSLYALLKIHLVRKYHF